MSSLWQLAEQAVRPQENTCEPPNPNQTTPWARRHRFMVVLKGEDLKAYVGMVAIKSLNVEERSKVDLTARAIKHAAEKLNKYPVYFAQLMNSKEGTKIESTRPMNAKPSTLEGYIVIIQQMVIFFWRAWKLGSHIGEERWQDCNGLEKIVTAVMRDRALADHVAKLGKSTDLSPVWSVGERVLVASMGSTLDTSPLALFLAAIGIEVPVNGNFKAAGIYTPLLSRLLYTLRLCFFAARVSELEDLQAQLDASEHLDVAEEFADAHTRALGSASKWSSGSRYIQGLRAFGMASAQAEGGRDQALWSEDGKQVMMDGNLITLEQVKCVMDDLIHLSVCKLDTLLQRANEPDTLRALVFDGLVDNPACSDPGMWFGTLQANKDLLPLAVYGEKILPDLVSVSKDVLTQKATLDVEWDAVQDLWQEETQFLRTLASTIHLTSGMPSRGSELFETTWQNSPGSRLRGICIGHNGEVFIDNTYSKVDYKATRLQQNVRFLHPTIGRVVVRYLCTVRQVSDALYMIKHGVRRYYLWSEYCDSAPRKETRWDSSILSRDLVIHAASRGMGPRVTISVWRQLLESIAHKFFRAGPMKDAFASMFKRVNDDHQPGDDDDLVSLGLEGYGDTTEDIAEVAADVMAGLRQRGQAGRAYQQDPFSAQSGRSDEMSWTFYGRNLSHRAGMDDGTMSSARWASRTYQAFFELFDGSQPHPTQETLVSSAPPVKRSEPKVILSGSTTSASQQETPRPSLKEATLALPPTWSFGSEGPVARLPLSLQISTILFDLLVAQESTGVRRAISPSITDAIHCIDRQITNCVVVSGTGTGKALTWQVGARRARMEGKFTVLVIPYVALLADVMRTCERKNIAAREWRVDTQADILASRPDVVVVSLNRVVSNDFLQWTARLEVRDAIRTVFVDECHVLVEETFRRSISEFARVTHILSEKQFVLLTATLPPALERDLERQICLPIKYLRDCTHRTNLQFSVEQARSVKDALVQAKVKIDQTLQEAKSGSQALVICKTVGEAVQAGSFLSCPTYHASLKEEGDEPHSSLAAFLGGSVKVLAGTTAAGVGIDISKIVLVIFLGDPYSIATFAQGAGRAGRDGTRAEVIVWRINSKKSSRTPAGPLPRSEAEALSTLLEGDVCMQQPLTGWLDGRVGSCIELGTEFCSVCRIEETLQTMPGDDVAGLLGYSDHADPSTTPEARSSSNVKTQPREETALPEAHLAPEERKLVRKGSFRDEPKSKTLQTPLKRPRVDMDTDLFGEAFPAGVWPNVNSMPPPTTPVKRQPRSAQTTPQPSKDLSTVSPWKQTSPFASSSSHSNPRGGFRGGSHGLGSGRIPSRSFSASHIAVNSHRPLMTLSAIGKTLTADMGSFSDHLVREKTTRATSPPASSVARLVNADANYARQLSDFATYQRLVREGLNQIVRRCPMCFMLERDDDHRPGSCKMPGVNWSDQQAFREHSDNNWGNREACFYCNMPQIICGRSNQEKMCPYQGCKDGVRGILLLLTLHSGVRHRAVEVATQINPEYQLSEPAGVGRMGASWRRAAPFGNDVSMYRAFQAVAAVLLMMGGGFTF